MALTLLGLVRRRDTRGAIVAGSLFGLLSHIAAVALGLGPAAAALFGLSAALAAAVLAPLAVGGILVEARWVLVGSSRRAVHQAAAATAAAVLATAVPVVPLAAALLVQGHLGVRAAGLFGLGVCLAAGCGALAGILAPWRAGAAADQTAALALLAALAAGAGCLAIGGGDLAERLAVPGTPVQVAIALAPLVGSALLGSRCVQGR